MADRQYRYAQIIIDISQEKLDRPFTYRIPDGLADQVEPGCRVRVPFGHTVRTGYVIELTDSCDLTMTEGISVPVNSTLNIYSQSRYTSHCPHQVSRRTYPR